MNVRPPGAVALQFVEPEPKSAVFERCKEHERQLVVVPRARPESFEARRRERGVSDADMYVTLVFDVSTPS